MQPELALQSMETVLQLKVCHIRISASPYQSDVMHIWVLRLVAKQMLSGLQPDLLEAQNEIAEVRVLVLQRKQQPSGVSQRI